MKSELPRVESGEDGFRVIQDGEVLHEVSWADVLEIYAFKRALTTVDLICLGFRIDESDRFLEVHEEMPGYKSLVQTLEQRFLLKTDWWGEVAFPAFETNMMSIWNVRSGLTRDEAR